jgi:hypothetical protein
MVMVYAIISFIFGVVIGLVSGLAIAAAMGYIYNQHEND